ncbi:unnamed protein product [Gulo gulo]|uniref:Uncharacterized protein n=1 Tax=Gulo gulo TaxID=48420 RepID=A0A9X9PYS8_GULGU|nr:unnamed protein product [Gulo gulo]
MTEGSEETTPQQTTPQCNFHRPLVSLSTLSKRRLGTNLCRPLALRNKDLGWSLFSTSVSSSYYHQVLWASNSSQCSKECALKLWFPLLSQRAIPLHISENLQSDTTSLVAHLCI